MNDRTIDNLRRRLEKWELAHLRQHAAELAERLEMAEERARKADEWAEYWRESTFDLQQSLMEDGCQIGITKEGQLLALKPVDGSVLEALQIAEAFMVGFEDDEAQEGLAEKLAKVRGAIVAVGGQS